MKLLVMIPAYNEAENIERVVDNLIRNYPQYDYVIINDGSTDDTRKVCARRKYNMLDLPVNTGLAGAIKSGMRYANYHGYDYVLQLDGDGQHDPKYIEEMIEEMACTDCDIVIGSRFVQFKKEHSARMFGSRIITFIVKMTTGKRVSDPTSGMRMFNRRMIELFAKDMSLNPEPETIAHLIRKGVMVEEVQVSMRDRTAGESYLNLTRSAAYMIRVCTSILFVQWFR